MLICPREASTTAYKAFFLSVRTLMYILEAISAMTTKLDDNISYYCAQIELLLEFGHARFYRRIRNVI